MGFLWVDSGTNEYMYTSFPASVEQSIIMDMEEACHASLICVTVSVSYSYGKSVILMVSRAGGNSNIGIFLSFSG